jgi:hypothetical protein
LGASESLVFKVKKLSNGIKDLKTVRRGDTKPKKQTVATEKHVTIVQIAEGEWLNTSAYQSLLCQEALPEPLLPILNKKRFSRRMARLYTPPFPLQKHRCTLANCSFAAIFATPNLAGLRHLGHIAAEGQSYSSPKNGCSEANHLAIAGSQT